MELGFNRENVLLFGLNARQAGYKGAALAQFYADLLNDFRRIPGVRSAGLSQFPLVDRFVEQLGLSRFPARRPRRAQSRRPAMFP